MILDQIDPDGAELRIGVRELRGNLTRYLRQVSRGSAILVTAHDRVIAEIRAPSRGQLAPRQPGALRGRIRMAADFDSLPPDLLAEMEA